MSDHELMLTDPEQGVLTLQNGADAFKQVLVNKKRVLVFPALDLKEELKASEFIVITSSSRVRFPHPSSSGGLQVGKGQQKDKAPPSVEFPAFSSC